MSERPLIAPQRAERPNEFRNGPEARCPFCPGNEQETPPEIARVTGNDGAWSARAFPNKYPMVREPDGMHHIIVDGREHGVEVTRDGLHMWRERYARLAVTHVPMLFKNVGLYGGATLRHPHTQIVGLHMVPPALMPLVDGESCVTCAERDAARAEDRFVGTIDGWSIYALDSDFSCDIVIAPERCAYDFSMMSDAQITTLFDILTPLCAAHDSFNLMLQALPPRVGRMHLRLRFVRRAGVAAGFELLSGRYVRIATAQESAQGCRQLLASAW